MLFYIFRFNIGAIQLVLPPILKLNENRKILLRVQAQTRISTAKKSSMKMVYYEKK